MSQAPELTQVLMMHLNGGSRFSELHYRVHADGKATPITRHKRTNGRPKYLIEADVFRCGDDEFDVMATAGLGLMDWLLAHVPTVALTENEESGEANP